MNTSFCYLLISFFVVSCNTFEYTFRGEKRDPEDFTDFGKALRASFFSPEGVFKRVTRNNKKGDEQMAKRSVHYARGPPE